MEEAGAMDTTERSQPSCLVVGAGLSGLVAARELQDAGWSVTIVDKAHAVGGRMASRHIALIGDGVATFDHGAQYFTVRSDRFRREVARWLDDGLVVQWSNGFATPDGSAYRDGHPRYRGQPTMTAIPRHLAAGLNVQRDRTITRFSFRTHWLAVAEDGETFASDFLLLTPPVPQTLALLAAGDVALPEAIRGPLERIDYDPCWALLAVLDGPSLIPEPGGLWPDGDVISWMADNRCKGMSAVPCVTIHGSPAFSRAHFDTRPGEVARLLLAAAQRWLGARVLTYQLKRWRYSIPVTVFDAPTLFTAEPGPIAFAGDAFAGPRIEGAFLSGIAAARALLAHEGR
jgi:predicted NAD/FAD-dependent oxidoreductase